MIDDKDRLEELKSYKILDTDPEKELDEITELASLIVGVPISLITFLDDSRQWFKSKYGFDKTSTEKRDSFCQFALNDPDNVLVIEDSHKDKRFIKSPLVTGNPNIRFYAGAPLKSDKGHVLGTLCVIDREPRTITESQKRALKMLASKAMDYINMRKLLIDQKETIDNSNVQLVKLTDQVPSGIFQLRMDKNEKPSFDFMSRGLLQLYPEIQRDRFTNFPESSFKAMVHPDDKGKFMRSLMDSFYTLKEWTVEFRVKRKKQIYWNQVKATPEKQKNGDVLWYGIFQDISSRKKYEQSMEQIAFDLSHVLRKPIMNLLGLAQIIEERKNINPKELKQFSSYIKLASQELDAYTRQLNKTYEYKKNEILSKP